MNDEYYGPGSEEYDRDMYEEFQEQYRESQDWAEQEEFERQQEEDAYMGQGALDEAAREDCYADYSGGRKPHMTCDYYTGDPTSSKSPQESSIIGSIFILVIIGTIILILVKRKG